MQQKSNFEDFIEISKAAVMMAKMSSTINRRASIGRRLSWSKACSIKISNELQSPYLLLPIHSVCLFKVCYFLVQLYPIYWNVQKNCRCNRGKFSDIRI